MDVDLEEDTHEFHGQRDRAVTENQVCLIPSAENFT